jgi:predicted Holliday junction resolvase-like endonuclease
MNPENIFLTVVLVFLVLTISIVILALIERCPKCKRRFSLRQTPLTEEVKHDWSFVAFSTNKTIGFERFCKHCKMSQIYLSRSVDRHKPCQWQDI